MNTPEQDKLREAFERHIRDRFPFSHELDLQKNKDGQYVSEQIFNCFITWKAALASVAPVGQSTSGMSDEEISRSKFERRMRDIHGSIVQRAAPMLLIELRRGCCITERSKGGKFQTKQRKSGLQEIKTAVQRI